MIKRNAPPSFKEIDDFLNHIQGKLPDGFIEFFSETNGAEIFREGSYIILWPLTDMIKLNQDYRVEEYAFDYFIFGSDGGDTAYCFKKNTGEIYDFSFIGMSNEDAIFMCETFTKFLMN